MADDDDRRALRDQMAEADRLREQIRRCAVSRDTRRANGAVLNDWYERGNYEGPESPFNKLRSHLDRVKSFVYSASSIRFTPEVPTRFKESWAPAAAVARDELATRWRNSGLGQIGAYLVEWSLVQGCVLAKLQADPDTGFRAGYIDPWDFGVSREDVSELDEQDAMCHWYSLSVPQIRRWVRSEPKLGARRREELVAIAREHESSARGGGGRPGLVISGVQGVFPGSTVSGGFPGDADLVTDMTRAMVDEPTVQFVDVWERRVFRRRGVRKDEEFEDWLVTTMIADADVIFEQRRNPVLPWTRTAHDVTLPGEHPFVAMRPRPLPTYFWGRSELRGLRRLQQRLTSLLDRMAHSVDLQLDPAKFFSGVPDYEEAGRALTTPGGSADGGEQGKMTPLTMQIGEEPFRLRALYEEMFADESGAPSSLTEPGTVPGGVRSTGQFGMVAGIASGRIKDMALVIEDPLGSLATKAYHLLQRHDDNEYPIPNTERAFGLWQLPQGITFKVDAHSSAPIFAEQRKADAVLAKKVGAISGEDFLAEIMPDRPDLHLKARQIDKSRAELTQEQLRIQAEKARGPRSRSSR